jgi:hypothetical protein
MGTSRSNLPKPRTHEQAWGSLLRFLSPERQRNSSDEVLQNYERICSAWRPVYRSSEREALQLLRLSFIDAIQPFIDATTRGLLAAGSANKAPQITSISAREQYFRVRNSGASLEYSLLGELRDAEGRSVVWQNGFLSSPTRNPMMLRIRSSDERQRVFQYDILYSRAAFFEEMELVKLLIEPFSSSIFSRPVLPVALRALATAAAECLNLEDLTEIDSIVVGPHIQTDTPSFIVLGRGRECMVRFTMRAELPFPVTRTTLL